MTFSTTVIVGASGGVGRLLASALRDHVRDLVGLDLRPSADPKSFTRFFVTDGASPCTEAAAVLRQCDCAIVATPLHGGLESARVILRALPPAALFVDSFSVKLPIADVVAECGAECEHLSINPMFAPGVGFAGQNLAAVGDRARLRSDAFLRILEALGVRVFLTTAGDHDRLAASVQAATHFAMLSLGGLLAAGGQPLGALLAMSSPPFRICLALLARMSMADNHAYWDVQASNRFAADIRHAFLNEAAALQATIDADDWPGFDRAFKRISGLLKPSAEDLSALAEQLVANAVSL